MRQVLFFTVLTLIFQAYITVKWQYLDQVAGQDHDPSMWILNVSYLVSSKKRTIIHHDITRNPWGLWHNWQHLIKRVINHSLQIWKKNIGFVMTYSGMYLCSFSAKFHVVAIISSQKSHNSICCILAYTGRVLINKYDTHNLRCGYHFWNSGHITVYWLLSIVCNL